MLNVRALAACLCRNLDGLCLATGNRISCDDRDRLPKRGFMIFGYEDELLTFFLTGEAPKHGSKPLQSEKFRLGRARQGYREREREKNKKNSERERERERALHLPG